MHGDRELLAPLDRPRGGGAPCVPARLLPRRLPVHPRRVAPDPAAGRRNVRGRPLPQADTGGLRVPPPPALDNRPLRIDEFMQLVPRIVFVSATPGEEELRLAGGVVVEQIIRPTGLVDPEVEVRPVKGQVDDLLHEIRLREKKGERVLVTTLTKRMAE